MEQCPCAAMNYPTIPEVVKATLAESNAVGRRAYETFLRCHLACFFVGVLIVRFYAPRAVGLPPTASRSRGFPGLSGCLWG
jgi:hypothetical protein